MSNATPTRAFLPWFGRFLLHPGTVFLGIGIGIYIGLEHPSLAAKMEKPSIIYLSLLQMCVLPIMISAVILSIGRLLRSGRANSFIIKLSSVIMATMLIASALGVAIGLIGKTGSNLQKSSKVLLGQEVANVEMQYAFGLMDDDTPKQKNAMVDFLTAMIPSNIFQAISEGQNLPVLFFCLILGIALGTIRSTSSDTAMAVADACYEAMLRVIGWTLYGLPFGLCCLFADQISKIGVNIFLALLKLIIFLYIGSFILMVGYMLVIMAKSGRGFRDCFRALRRALVVSIGTSSSFAAIPFALEALHRDLKFEKDTVDLVIPLSTALNPPGNAICFGLVAVFIAQLYNVNLTLGDILLIIPLSAVAGIVASSAPGLASVAMLSIVLDPFGLPTVVAIILVSAINPVIDPILTAVNLYGNCATTALVAPPISPPSKQG